MTSNFQSYSVPFDARVPHVYPGSLINDEFSAQSPGVVPTPPSRPYVTPDPKWLPFVPGELATLSYVVDPVRQMLRISGVADKTWTGVKQPLPVPDVGETGVAYNIVTRMLNGYVQASGNDDWGPMAWGLLIGDNLIANEQSSQLWCVAAQMLRFDGLLTGSSFTAELLDYSAPVVADGQVEALAFQFLCAEVLSVQLSPGVFESQITFSVSADGIFFQRLFQYADLPVALRGFALAQQTVNGAGLGTYVDFLRYFDYVPDDSAPFIGQVLQLGSL